MHTLQNFSGYSKIILGTVDFGTKLSKTESFSLLDKYFELGGNTIDTGNNYADWYKLDVGASEKYIGEWLKSRKPSHYNISTKAGFRWDLENKSELSLNYLKEQLDTSLRRLGVEQINVFWLHRDDRNIPITEVVQTVQALIDTGKILRIGCSNWQTDRIHMFQKTALKLGLTQFACIQPLWSLAKRNPISDGLGLVSFDSNHVDMCLEYDLTVFPYSSQAAGFFSGNYSENIVPQSNRTQEVQSYYYSETNFLRLKRADVLAIKKNTSCIAISLAFLLNYPLDVLPIIGPRTIEQIATSFKALDISISREEINYLLDGHLY